MTSAHTAQTFNPNHAGEAAIVQALARGEHTPVLQAFFGVPLHAELQALAIRLSSSEQRGPRVYVLPGLLGSRLGIAHPKGEELLWLEPAALTSGRLLELAIGRRRSVKALGAMLPGYLKLKLTLQVAGFDAVFWPYDWRRGVRELGEKLAYDLAADPAREIMLVAHSMGGLVARVAMRQLSGAKLSRIVQIGTPNLGAPSLVQALRAVYPTVLKLGAVDPHHDAAMLAQRVFRSFYSLYDMLPRHCEGLDLFNAQHWPGSGWLTPDIERLKQGRRLSRHLAAADRRCHAIVGMNQRTVTQLQVRGEQFIYSYTPEGDGTVPGVSAHWPGAQHWHVDEAHGQLPRHSAVCQAVVDLLLQETTTQLRMQTPATSLSIIECSERELRQQLNGKLRWDALPLNERRDLLEPVISPVFAALCVSSASASASGQA